MLVDPSVARVLKEHLEAALQYLDEGNYSRLTIQANRLITEATLWGDRQELATVGLVVRLAALDLQPSVASRQLLAYPQKQAAAALLKDLIPLVGKEGWDLSTPWKVLSDFHAGFWSDLRPRLEGKSYTENPEFVSKVVEWALATVRDSWELIAQPTGSPIAGAVNEINRVMKAHGATPRELARYGVLQTLAWHTDYVKWQSVGAGGVVDPPRAKELFRPLVERAAAALSLAQDDNRFYGSVADASFEILRAWRSAFAKYYDLYQRQEKERVGIELVPAEATKEESTAPSRRRRKA